MSSGSQRGLDTVQQTQVAHAELMLARRRRDPLIEVANTWERVAALARVRLEAGAASRLEVTAAGSDALTARVERQRLVEAE
jgi:hypothetical protein